MIVNTVNNVVFFLVYMMQFSVAIIFCMYYVKYKVKLNQNQNNKIKYVKYV